jgi:hypothetical protein
MRHLTILMQDESKKTNIRNWFSAHMETTEGSSKPIEKEILEELKKDQQVDLRRSMI